MSSKKHHRCQENCEPESTEEVFVPEIIESSSSKTPFLLFLILILLILTFGKREILAKIKMLLAKLQGSADMDVEIE